MSKSGELDVTTIKIWELLSCKGHFSLNNELKTFTLQIIIRGVTKAHELVMDGEDCILPSQLQQITEAKNFGHSLPVSAGNAADAESSISFGVCRKVKFRRQIFTSDLGLMRVTEL